MRGVVDAVLPPVQPFERGHVIRHVAVGGRDYAGRPAHHMVAGEQRPAFLQREAQMVRCVAGRGQRGERPAGAGQALPVGQHPIGRVVAVERRVRARAGAFKRERGAADHRGAGAARQRRGAGRMVAMGVGAADRGDGRVSDRHFQCRKVIGIVGAGIDHRDPACRAHEVGLRAGIGEGGCIGRQHAADQRLQLFADAGRPGLRRKRHAPHMGDGRADCHD